MNKAINPSTQAVKPGALINLIVYDDKQRLRRKQFLVIKSFDHVEILNNIRNQGILKSEDVFTRLTEILVERSIVKPVETYTLDLGDVGRPSTALQTYYKHTRNPDAAILEEVIQNVEKSFNTFKSSEGDLHLMKVEDADTLAQVNVIITLPNELTSYTTLDLTGPPDADYPSTLEEDIAFAIKADILTKWPELVFDLVIRIRKSELALAKEALLKRI